MHPQPRRVTQFDGDAEDAIEGVEEWQLDQHRHAAADRVDALLLVQSHYFLVLLRLARIVDLDVLVFLVDGLDLRLDALHFARRLQAGKAQREQREIDDQRDAR